MIKRTLILEPLGLSANNSGGMDGRWVSNGPRQTVISPVDGAPVADVTQVTSADLERIIQRCFDAFETWREVPAPKRGEVVKELGLEVKQHQSALAQLVTLEMGKPLREAMGEVQEMIDIFDLAVGLSRQQYGLTMPSERRLHRLQEQWHPLGAAGVITAFNFPVAVWSWNAALALVCGDTVLWKPSSKTPLSAIACTLMAQRVLVRHGYPAEICSLAIGAGSQIGDRLTTDLRLALISYTGSVARGRQVGQLVQARFGRHILELGGNNAVIVSDKADLDMALQAVYFGAIGTAGQRCTTTRRVIVQQNIYKAFVERLVKLYAQTAIGDPFDSRYVMGPLVDTHAVENMLSAMDTAKDQGARVLWGGEKLALPGGCYVTPCLVEATNHQPIVREETFAPILYLMTYDTFETAIALHNDVPQGLSGAVITNDLLESERFLSAGGAHCGIANVNAGTSGAEIGGAFGGEKETGGGRESGSDAWKAYMRRQTNTINFSGAMELAQGIRLDG